MSAAQGTLSRKPTVDKEQIEEDMSVMSQVEQLAGRLSCQHQVGTYTTCSVITTGTGDGK